MTNEGQGDDDDDLSRKWREGGGGESEDVAQKMEEVD